MNEAPQSTGETAPRGYCVANRRPPFQGHAFEPGAPTWRKVGRGLLAVTDGTPRQYVGPGLIYAVDRDEEGKPRIASYGCAAEPNGLAATKPYTYETLRSLVATDKIVRRQWISYEEMVAMVRRLLPMAWVPTQDEFWSEYGLNAEQD